MSDITDNEMSKALRSKFGQFEADVRDEVWEGLAEEVRKPGKSDTSRRRLIWMLSILLITLTGLITFEFFYEPQSEAGQTVNNPGESFQTNNLEMDEKTIGKSQEQEAEHTGVAASPSHADGLRASNKGQVNNPEINKSKEIRASLDWSPVKHSTLSNQASERLSDLERQSRFSERNIIPNQILLRDWESDFGLPKYHERRTELSFKRTRLMVRLNVALTMNYVRIRPNRNDDILFEDTNETLDLSLDHLGLRIGYDLWFHLDSRFWLKNQIFLDARQYKIDLRYDLNAGAEPDLRSLRAARHIASIGLATGFIYQIDDDDVKKRSLDFLISYEQSVLNQFRKDQLLRYPKGLWTVNLGFTFSSKRGRDFQWLIRPFAYYGLNRNFSDSPAELTPYGFGIQLIRHR